MKPSIQVNIAKLEELASELHLEFYEDLSLFSFIEEGVQKVPYLFVKKHALIPLYEEGDEMVVALSDPYHFEVLEELRHRVKKRIREVLAPPSAIEKAIEKCYRKQGDDAYTFTPMESNPNKDEEDGYDLLDQRSDQPIIKLLNHLLLEAIAEGASDLHFEPEEKRLLVRFRVDGVLHEVKSISRELQPELLTRLKVLSKLDIADHRLPQDGRMKLKIGGREIDFRVSTVPIVFGERIVLRILDRGNILLGLDQLHVPPLLLKKFRDQIGHSQGIVLVTGPTGSGKTTTLYSALSELHSSEVNIMTIEDPVEFKLQGMAQIGVNPKISLNFSTGLRHILRQDPDIIMIGEIRDKETAEIAIQSALTGHLVLSTLHTNDAPSAVTRLIDMGIEPFLISASLNAVLAQRLVRVICPHCKEAYEATYEECSDLHLAEKSATLYRGKGCKECFQLGYKGRMGIYEMMQVSSSIKQQMLKSADNFALTKLAKEEGMISLREEGIRLALEGLTTASEVIRVTGKVMLEES